MGMTVSFGFVILKYIYFFEFLIGFSKKAAVEFMGHMDACFYSLPGCHWPFGALGTLAHFNRNAWHSQTEIAKYIFLALPVLLVLIINAFSML